MRLTIQTHPWSFWLALLGWGWLGAAFAGAPCEPAAGQVVSVQGEVLISRGGSPRWVAATLREMLCPGDRIRIEARSRAAVRLVNDTILRLDQDTTATFSQVKRDAPSWVELLRGAAHFLSRVPQRLNIRTPFVNAGIEGTEFVVRVATAEARIFVLEGQVLASNAAGRLRLTSGEAAAAEAGKPPRRIIVVKPRDAVQWALYYPPLIDYRESTWASGPGAGARRAALASYRAGDLPAAFDALEGIPSSARDARYHTLRAGLLLSIGRLDEARPALHQALAEDPENATAIALQAVIAVAQNDTAQALEAAQTAVRRDPSSPIAHIALSYAQQAHFHIDQARKSIEKAVQLDPGNALAWARLAELWLASGSLHRALAAAQSAARLDPKLERTQTVLGFAALNTINVEQAKAAFEQAIALDPAAPLPRLGLGLTHIRQGQLKQGTHEIETAALLDPANALIRSYLGKAYYEQKRGGLAATEFANAKALDPSDPTPWFYDAIYKQTVNRPVEALHDMQRAIALNDNRAVYRSRLLLDQDQAARGASLARIFDDLGFPQAALVEATKSLTADPANHSAHRFLSDTYASRPRHEIARDSELLQAQLLQPINVNPIQPQLAITDLNILSAGGPATASFNEFTRLFETNRPQLVASGVWGNRDTLGGEAVLSGLFNRLSYSLGAFHVETDGFRENNDLLQTAYDAFLQVEATPKLNLQAEARHRNAQYGDLSLNFDPNEFFDQDRTKLDQTTLRAGARFSPAAHSDIILSFIHNESDEKNDVVLFNRAFEFVSAGKGYQLQGQYLFRTERHNLVAGASFYRIDVNEELGSFKSSFAEDQDTVYLYSNVAWPTNTTWTVGLSYDRYEERQHKLVDQVSPKLGLQWQLTENLRLRAAALRTAKPALVADQTIEPTQVAGFNQFFDDINGTKTELYGLGLDARLGSTLYAGVEGSRRALEAPFFVPPSAEFETQDWREALLRAYLYWAPHANWAVSTEYQLDKFKIATTETIFPLPVDIPTRVQTTSIPIVMRYFNRYGFFGALGARYVHQDVDLSPASMFEQDSDDFFLFDAAIGYRLPKRLGILSMEVKNLLDEQFLFQDDSFRSSIARLPSLVPGRILLARMTFNWD